MKLKRKTSCKKFTEQQKPVVGRLWKKIVVTNPPQYL